MLAIVLLGACAVLTGARSFAAIGEYAHDTGRAILERLGVGVVVPHVSTIRRVLQDLDPNAVEAAMRTWALAQLADDRPPRLSRSASSAKSWPWTARPCAAPTSISTDTGAAADTDAAAGMGGGYRQPHLLAVIDQHTGVVLGQLEVDGQDQRDHRVHPAARHPDRRST